MRLALAEAGIMDSYLHPRPHCSSSCLSACLQVPGGSLAVAAEKGELTFPPGLSYDATTGTLATRHVATNGHIRCPHPHRTTCHVMVTDIIDATAAPTSWHASYHGPGRTSVC